ncbi:MAG: hypothetical protein AAGA54_19300 [Myxococcota bacterium]
MSAQTPRSRRHALCAALLLALPGSAFAATPTVAARPALGTRLSQQRVLPYPVTQVWGAAIRYLRVDRDYAIVDRDPDTGYIVFEIPLGGDRRGRGALEAFETTDASGRPSTQLQVSTEAGPTHLPHTLMEGIAKKVRGERGQAPPPPPKAPVEPPKGDDDDGGLPRMPPAVNPDRLPLE